MTKSFSFKKKIFLFVGGGLVGLVILAIWQYLLFFDGRLHLTICNVGQGDAIYLRTPKGADILIDGGPNDQALSCLSRHMPFWDRQLEMVILTHPQADHLTGLISVFKNYQVKYFLAESLANPTTGFQELRRAISKEQVEILIPQAGDKITIGGIKIKILWPKEKIGDLRFWQNPTESDRSKEIGRQVDLNTFSIISEIIYADFNAILVGDADLKVLSEAIGGSEGNIEVLQVPHHGSRFGLNEEILEKIQPEMGIISVGKNNRYGHPAKETLDLLREKTIRVLRTDEDGDIEIISDGRSWNARD